MAFLRVEKKKSGTYLRIIETYRNEGRVKHKTLYTLGKAEDYTPVQLQAIAKKLLQLAGLSYEDFVKSNAGLKELARYNYGYVLAVNKLWQLFGLDKFSRIVSNRHKIKFDWTSVLKLMIIERLNEPGSKLRNYLTQEDYIGFEKKYELQYFYRTLDLLYKEEDFLKKHLFKQQRSIFSENLDVVFYDVTTLYFDSQKEIEGNLRKKGYSKDGQARKVQIVLGLLVDKLRNPITYQIYEGNSYEGHTMIEALETLTQNYNIDKAIVVADSAMIDKDNRDYIVGDKRLDFILGDSIKKLPENIQAFLLDKSNHKAISKDIDKEIFSYAETIYKDRRIICSYSEKRAKKDAYEREKLIAKATYWIENPSKFKQVKKRGAGRFIQNSEGEFKLDLDKIEHDARFDGFKAIATTTDITAQELIDKYTDLYNVEHSFRTLKSQLEIRPVFHWTNTRIRGHIAMCFIAYAFLNYLRNVLHIIP